MARERHLFPIFQVEKIRYCINKLDKELRGLDDIKDLKVTPVSFIFTPCLLNPSLPHFQRPLQAPALMCQPLPHPRCLSRTRALPNPAAPGDPDL